MSRDQEAGYDGQTCEDCGEPATMRLWGHYLCDDHEPAWGDAIDEDGYL